MFVALVILQVGLLVFIHVVASSAGQRIAQSHTAAEQKMLSAEQWQHQEARITQDLYVLRAAVRVVMTLAFFAAVVVVIQFLDPGSGVPARPEDRSFQQTMANRLAWHLGLGMLALVLAWQRHGSLRKRLRATAAYIGRHV